MHKIDLRDVAMGYALAKSEGGHTSQSPGPGCGEVFAGILIVIGGLCVGGLFFSAFLYLSGDTSGGAELAVWSGIGALPFVLILLVCMCEGFAWAPASRKARRLQSTMSEARRRETYLKETHSAFRIRNAVEATIVVLVNKNGSLDPYFESCVIWLSMFEKSSHRLLSKQPGITPSHASLLIQTLQECKLIICADEGEMFTVLLRYCEVKKYLETISPLMTKGTGRQVGLQRLP